MKVGDLYRVARVVHQVHFEQVRQDQIGNNVLITKTDARQNNCRYNGYCVGINLSTGLVWIYPKESLEVLSESR